MACITGERCQNSFEMDGYIRTKRSEHTKCDKCYVCSETNLHNAEVFKGVVFCSSCAQRIFQSCDSVKRKKQQIIRGKKMNLGFKKPVPGERRRRRETSRPRKKLNRDVHHVIELSQQVRSSCDSYQDEKKRMRSSKTQITAGLALQVTKNVPYKCRRVKSFEKQSTEIGITTDITQELLNEINACFKSTTSYETHKTAVAPIPKNVSPMISRLMENKERVHLRNKPICSDLRIAELGASTEIANMALRKKSEVPVIIRSDNQLKAMKSYSDSTLNLTDKIEDDVGLDSAYGSLKGSEIWVSCMDGGISKIMKMPIKFFKKNILNRSSLVSLIMTRKHKAGIIRRLKNVFYEDLTEQQGRGMKRLYSTINRRKIAYKLGWLHLAAKVSKPMFSREDHKNRIKVGCKHYKMSHSYRCMRDQAMKLAGPTRSQLACVRRKIKRCVTAKYLRNVLKSMYVGKQLGIPGETAEHQILKLVSEIMQQPTQKTIHNLKTQSINQTVQKYSKQSRQQSSLQPTLQSSQQPLQQLQPIQKAKLSIRPVMIRQRTPLINQQPYQQITYQPFEQIVQPEQKSHQPKYLQMAYQSRNDHGLEKQKGIEKRYAQLITTVPC